MVFRIEVGRGAAEDIDETVDFIARNSPAAAGKWFAGVFAAIDSLAEMPSRHALIAESKELGRDLRSLPYRSHRIIYEVNEAEQYVYIARVYHGARQPLTAEDLEP